MSLLTVNNLEKAFEGETILTGISFRLEWRQKLGLVGRNGTGKTTLLRMLTGQIEQDRGTINYSPGIRLGYLKQEEVVDPSHTVLQEAEAAFAPVLAMEQRLRDVEQEMAGATDEAQLTRVMQEYGILHDRFEAMGGYDNLRDIPSVLKRLGFGANDLDKTCGRLSGGERTRLGVARLLLSGPDIFFLDEPTNHLDIEATEWLEGFLRDFGGGVVLVSHDRYFLDRVTTSIAEIERTKLTLYTGNFSAYWTQKQERRERQAEMYEREQEEIAKLTQFFEKWKNTPTKRAQAFSRLRWAERIRANATEKPTGPSKSMKVAIKPTTVGGDDVVIVQKLTKKFGDRTLFENVNLIIRRGERVGIVGPNGAGKSTLIKMILSQDEPTSGSARIGANISVGYFAQDTSDLDLEATVLENMLDVAEMLPVEARTYLGRFLFTGDDVFRPVKLLSGGEKNKLALAQLTYLKPNLLILDEPTNHLDLDSREALGEMLRGYEGTLILVSHDRYLLDQATNRTLEIANGAISDFDGSYGQYRVYLTEKRNKIDGGARKTDPKSKKPHGNGSKVSAPAPVATIGPTGLNFHQLSKEKQRAEKSVLAAEDRVAELEKRLQEIEAGLSSPSPDTDAVALASEHGTVQDELAQAISEWEEAAAYAEMLGV
jgi:ATP-binding cassette subfamily F protein 3